MKAFRYALLCSFSALTLSVLLDAPALAQAPNTSAKNTTEDRPEKTAPVDVQADELSYDEGKKTITASGNVVLSQLGRVLKAEKVTYDIKQDKAQASGNVVLIDPSGSTHYARDVLLTKQFKNGTVQQLKTLLNDGSSFTAEQGVRTDGNLTVMRRATYTACKRCEGTANDKRSPAWQLKSSKVSHDQDARTVQHKDARFELYGVPVFYLPYFSHPDGTLDQKSGFLGPTLRFKGSQGFMVENAYYQPLSSSHDLTIGVRAFTKENPLLMGQWRKRWNDALLEVNASGTYSTPPSDTPSEEGNGFRGHLDVDFLWSLNKNWRTGADINVASDDPFMDEYDFSDEDVLVSDLYLERFSRRHYGSVHFLTFQDTRELEDDIDQPEVIPEIQARFKGAPGAVPYLKGNWFANTSYLGLRRSGAEEQDVDRMSLETGWERRFVSDYGFLTHARISVNNDYYAVRDSEAEGQDNPDEFRSFPQAHLVSSYPMVKNRASYQATFEPVLSVTVAPNMGDQQEIPNEDSLDVQLDADNIFEPSRFPGIDRVEDNSRVTYGMRAGANIYGRGEMYGVIAQSYSLEDDPLFPEGSGLSARSSDVVGALHGQVDAYSLDYSFQLASSNLSPNRHEVNFGADFGRYGLSSRYLFSRKLEDSVLDADREQLGVNAFFSPTKAWTLKAGIVRDFGEIEGLRKSYIGLNHYHDCYSWQLRLERDLVDDVSKESDTSITFRIGFKNLGEFSLPEWER